MTIIKQVIKLIRYIRTRDPIYFTMGYVFSALFLICLAVFHREIHGQLATHFPILTFGFAFAPVILCVIYIINFKQFFTSLSRIASFYLQIVILFGVIYFTDICGDAAMQFKDHKEKKIALNYQSQTIKGIDGKWVIMVRDPKLKASSGEIMKHALLCFQDCIHFSLITSATVGYGDMLPVDWKTKLLVDIQVLISFFIAVFGVGSYFAKAKG